MSDAAVVPIRSELWAVPSGPTVDTSQSLGEVALAVLRRQIGTLFELEDAIRDGHDPEAIHDARVAIRRARTALRLFRDGLPDRAQPLRAELRWVGLILGDVRDIDVLRAQFASWTDEGSRDERLGLETADALLAARRMASNRLVIEALASHRYAALRYGLLHVVHGGGSPGTSARAAVVEVAPALIRKQYRAVRRAGDSLDDRAPTESMHELRIQAKKLRYAVQFLGPMYGAPARVFARRVAALQDLIGDLRDAEVAIDTLSAIVTGNEVELDGKARFALGSVAERRRRRAKKLRRGFPDSFKRIRGRRWKDLKRAMQAAGR